MNLSRTQLAAVFNEWALRYADNPEDFAEILDEDGIPVEDYGERCAVYLEQLAGEMAGSWTLPLPDAVTDTDDLCRTVHVCESRAQAQAVAAGRADRVLQTCGVDVQKFGVFLGQGRTPVVLCAKSEGESE
ncbi:hypothetical protein [Marinobacterium stanieri]|uniref:hypothetical protein n=1 Tax=Marinobacterium stanieri TaxID=49186 RepID=UPI0002558F19|nr:hypothetical protein [Marinobacterium stanieri]